MPKVASEHLLAFGAAVRLARVKRGWTLEDLSETALGAKNSKGFLSAIEHGKRMISPLTAAKLVTELGLSDELLVPFLEKQTSQNGNPTAYEPEAGEPVGHVFEDKHSRIHASYKDKQPEEFRTSRDTLAKSVATESQLGERPNLKSKSICLDLALLATLSTKSEDKYFWDMNARLNVGHLCDPDVGNASKVAKLNRWRAEGYVKWKKSSKIQLTPLGQTYFVMLLRVHPEARGCLDQIGAILDTLFGISPNFGAVLSAR